MGWLVELGLRRPNMWERPTVLDMILLSPLQWLVFRVYQLVLWLRGRPFSPPRGRLPIRVVCLSDTHDRQPVHVPDGDLLIHAGDLTDDGSLDAIQKHLDWLATLPHRHKVVVAGNHDSWFDERSRKPHDRESGRDLDLHGAHYLQDASVTLAFHEGRMLNVYGCGDLPVCGGSDFAFQYERQSPPWKERIPDETDVLVTHTPPRYHRDLSLGCAGLLEEVWRVKPKLHVFGHVHWGKGQEPVYFDKCQRAYEAAMARPCRGALFDLFPHPGWIDACWVLWYGAKAVLWKWIMQGPESSNGALMVNAAVMHGNTGKLGKEIQVVDL